jgi:glycosyltransferase involved in cell wall biosynthesis
MAPSALRVAIVVPVYPPYRGGIGTVAAHDAEQLRRAGHAVEVFTPAYKKQSAKEAGVTRLQPFYAWGNAAVLFGLLSKVRGFDVVHVHYPFFGSDILAAFACRLWNIPLVLTYHMTPKAAGILGATFVAYRAVLQPIIFSVARAVLVSSDEYANEQRVKHRRRIAHPFSVDVERFAPGDRRAAQEYFGIPQDVPVVVFVGGLDAAHYFKGLDVLLRAFALMTVRARLLVVGDGNRREHFESLAKALPVADRAHFVGSVPFEDLPLAYRAADVHVLPSIDRSEAFGIVTQEAMATGIPSIVSDLPGVRTLVRPGETGAHVPPNDLEGLAKALDQFCADAELRSRCGAAARERAVREFSCDHLTNALAEVYKTVISEHK